jgi:ElaB/YqjD/DUF883 family membrane-anchored ribosome-binding protein
VNSLSSSPNQTGVGGDVPTNAVDQLTQDAVGVARDASDLATREATRAGDLARDWWKRNSQVAMDAAGAVKQEAVALTDNTQRYVRDEPAKSLLIAAAAGALITGLFMMASRR